MASFISSARWPRTLGPMETDMFAGMLLHPLAICLLAGTVLVSARVLYRNRAIRPPISGWELFFGYLSVTIVGLVIAAVSSYVSPEEAIKWHVSSERYWATVLNEFAALAIVITYISIFGIAVVGAPVVFALARRGLGTVPWILVASLTISILVASAAAWYAKPYSGFEEKLHDLVRAAPVVIGSHLVLSLSFCIGARLPWGLRSTRART